MFRFFTKIRITAKGNSQTNLAWYLSQGEFNPVVIKELMTIAAKANSMKMIVTEFIFRSKGEAKRSMTAKSDKRRFPKYCLSK